VEKWQEEKGTETILPPKTNLMQDSQGNEENGHPVAEFNKTKIK
jgi:hypothetical protein